MLPSFCLFMLIQLWSSVHFFQRTLIRITQKSFSQKHKLFKLPPPYKDDTFLPPINVPQNSWKWGVGNYFIMTLILFRRSDLPKKEKRSSVVLATCVQTLTKLMIQITFLERFLILRSVTSLLRLSMLHFNSVIENLAASSGVHKIVDTRLYISKKLAPISYNG